MRTPCPIRTPCPTGTPCPIKTPCPIRTPCPMRTLCPVRTPSPVRTPFSIGTPSHLRTPCHMQPSLDETFFFLLDDTSKNSQNIKLQSRILCFSRKLTSRLVGIKRKQYNFPMIANHAIVQFPTNKTHPQSHNHTCEPSRMLIWLQSKRLVHNVQHNSDQEK